VSEFSSVQPQPGNILLRISDERQLPLVTVYGNGDTTIHRPGAITQAAEAFWRAVQVHGQSLYARIRRLETERNDLQEALDAERDNAMLHAMSRPPQYTQSGGLNPEDRLQVCE
jgi:hypothetical protein